MFYIFSVCLVSILNIKIFNPLAVWNGKYITLESTRYDVHLYIPFEHLKKKILFTERFLITKYIQNAHIVRKNKPVNRYMKKNPTHSKTVFKFKMFYSRNNIHCIKLYYCCINDRICLCLICLSYNLYIGKIRKSKWIWVLHILY